MATRMQWLGHSTLLFDSDGHHVLVDPFLNDNPKSPIKADAIPADTILVSHGHGDHIGDAVAIAKRTGATIVCNYEISVWLQKQGVHAHGMQHGGGFGFPFGRVKLTQAWHGSMLPDGSNGGVPAGFLITFNDGKTVYDAADTGLFGDMRLIGEEGVELALLPIGDNFTMGPDDALKAVKLIQPKRVVPIHYNTFPLIEQDAQAWGKLVKQETGVEVIVMNLGDWIEV